MAAVNPLQASHRENKLLATITKRKVSEWWCKEPARMDEKIQNQKAEFQFSKTNLPTFNPLHPGHFRRFVVWAVANIRKPDLLANPTGKLTTPSPVPQGAARCMCGSIQDPATLPPNLLFLVRSESTPSALSRFKQLHQLLHDFELFQAHDAWQRRPGISLSPAHLGPKI